MSDITRSLRLLRTLREIEDADQENPVVNNNPRSFASQHNITIKEDLIDEEEPNDIVRNLDSGTNRRYTELHSFPNDVSMNEFGETLHLRTGQNEVEKRSSICTEEQREGNSNYTPTKAQVEIMNFQNLRTF